MTQSPDSVVVLDRVSKRYPGAAQAALLPTSLEIARGEFFSLLGPSGSGKTTTLRMIAGFETPDTGRVILDAPLEFRSVTIEDGADIGVSAVILPGITIGKGAQIGAGAVVSQDIPAFAIAAGVPARVVRQRP